MSAKAPTKTSLAGELVDIDTLKRFPGNPRTHNIDEIRASLRKNGQYRPIVVRAKTRHILAGHGTVEAAQAEGWREIWATFVDIDARTARRIVLVDNRANDLAGYDAPELARLLQAVGDDLEGTGFVEEDVEKLLAKIDPDLDASPAEIPESFQVLVTCDSETGQTELLERLTSEGLQCQALIS